MFGRRPKVPNLQRWMLVAITTRFFVLANFIHDLFRRAWERMFSGSANTSTTGSMLMLAEIAAMPESDEKLYRHMRGARSDKSRAWQLEVRIDNRMAIGMIVSRPAELRMAGILKESERMEKEPNYAPIIDLVNPEYSPALIMISGYAEMLLDDGYEDWEMFRFLVFFKTFPTGPHPRVVRLHQPIQ
jgi:hypothetical protein